MFIDVYFVNRAQYDKHNSCTIHNPFIKHHDIIAAEIIALHASRTIFGLRNEICRFRSRWSR